jgi:uncharacterized protein YndB with AHSA1/START domain
MAEFKIQRTILIHRPVEEVYAFATDFEKAHLWHDGLVVYEKLTPGALGVGTEFRQKYKDGLEVKIKVLEIEINKKYYSLIEHKWMQTYSQTCFQSRGGVSTLVKSKFEVKPKLMFLDFIGKGIAPFLGVRQEATLRQLKAILEKNGNYSG